MATYKQPCIHCGEFIQRDSHFCPKCCSNSPFGFLCPTCLKPIQKDDTVCSGCGRQLFIPCPVCGKQTFIGSEKCGHCSVSLMVLCQNPRCGRQQFFQNTKCTACGKKIKAKRG